MNRSPSLKHLFECFCGLRRFNDPNSDDFAVKRYPWQSKRAIKVQQFFNLQLPNQTLEYLAFMNPFITQLKFHYLPCLVVNAYMNLYPSLPSPFTFLPLCSFTFPITLTPELSTMRTFPSPFPFLTLKTSNFNFLLLLQRVEKQGTGKGR